MHSSEPSSSIDNGFEGKQTKSAKTSEVKKRGKSEKEDGKKAERICQRVDDGDECVEMEVEGQRTEFYSEDETISETEDMETEAEDGEIEDYQSVEEDANNNASVSKKPRLSLDIRGDASPCDSRAET